MDENGGSMLSLAFPSIPVHFRPIRCTSLRHRPTGPRRLTDFGRRRCLKGIDPLFGLPDRRGRIVDFQR
jgi:hypothetical protein